jgi:hypothetical protein
VLEVQGRAEEQFRVQPVIAVVVGGDRHVVDHRKRFKVDPGRGGISKVAGLTGFFSFAKAASMPSHAIGASVMPALANMSLFQQ